MKWLLAILLIIIVILVIEIVAYLTRKTTIYLEDTKVENILKRKNNFNINESNEEEGIPKNIIQTYKNKESIPEYVFNNLKNKNPDWKYHFYDDNQCEEFIKKYYGKEIYDKYLKINRGAHRADIFRLCWLYKYGGIYVDIDTELLINLDELVEKIQGSNLSIPITHDKLNRKRLLNCVIITSKGNPLIKKSLENILKVEPEEINRDLYYHLYLLAMQGTLGKDFKYHLKEINESGSDYYFLDKSDWIIVDNKDTMIGRSRYGNYSQKVGFKDL